MVVVGPVGNVRILLVVIYTYMITVYNINAII